MAEAPMPGGSWQSEADGFHPPYTTADEQSLGAEATAFEALAGRITGRGGELSTAMNAGAKEFSDIVAGPVRARSGDNLKAVEGATQGAVFGGTVAHAMVGDIATFKSKIQSLVQEWQTQQADNFGVDLDQAKSPMAVNSARDGLHAKLMGQANQAHSQLEDDIAKHAGMLKKGPSADGLKDLADAGYLGGWAGFNLFGADGAGVAPGLAADLLRRAQSGEKLSTKERRELNMLLGIVGKKSSLSKDILKRVEPEVFVKSYARLVQELPGNDGKDFQTSMSLILAAGTAAGGVDRKWKNRFVKMIGKNISFKFGEAKGSQIIAPLLDKGKFETKFLNRVSDAIWDVKPEKGADVFLNSKAENPFDALHPTYVNPLSSVMEALSRNSDSAVHFFSGNGGDHDARLDRINYMVEHMGPWKGMPDSQIEGQQNFGGQNNTVDLVINPNALGKAFEAASTGGDVLGKYEDGVHSLGNVEVTQRLIEVVGDDPGRFERPDSPGRPMLDSLGNIASDYREDLYRAYSGNDVFKYVPEHGTDHLGFTHKLGDQGNLTQFMQAIGHDEMNDVKMRSALESTAVQTAVNALHGENVDHGMKLEHAFTPYSEAMADVGDGKMEAIRDDTWKVPPIEDQKKVALGVGIGAGFVPGGPGPGGTVGWAGSELFNAVTTPTTEAAGRVTWTEQADMSKHMWNIHNHDIQRMTGFVIDKAGVEMDARKETYMADIGEYQTRYYAEALDPTPTEDGGHPANGENWKDGHTDDSWYNRIDQNFGWKIG